MPTDFSGGSGLSAGGTSGIAFLVSAGITYEVVAACCSSPQTSEINASTRGATLQKWVNLGLIQAGAFVLVAAVLDKQHAGAIIAGGGLAAGLLWWQYRHALKAGLASKKPGTEQVYA